MVYNIKRMDQCEAMEIADNWKYENEYSFYNMTEDVEDYKEIISEANRANNYFSVLKNAQLYGFFCVNKEENEIELGLGMKPEYTNKGEGVEFVNHILNYVKASYDAHTIVLNVASFNIRAIKVYEKVGFIVKERTMINTNGGKYEFIRMKYNIEKY